MRIIHICDGWERSNGAANIARMIASEQEQSGHHVSMARWASCGALRSADEVWVHCAWKPCLWWAALCAKRLKWMPEASYDPVRLGYHGWKKRLVGPIERFFLRRADVVVATCEAEAEWIRAYEPCVKTIEVVDIKRFFDCKIVRLCDCKIEGVDDCKIVRLGDDCEIVRLDDCKIGRESTQSHNHTITQSHNLTILQSHNPTIHLLYLGRRHPLKGVEYLEAAVRELEEDGLRAEDGKSFSCELRIVSNAFGEEKEKVWDWCDVLVLPTLSENFGLVVAEALERGKHVITTDGAPAWGEGLGDCEIVRLGDCKIGKGDNCEIGGLGDCDIGKVEGCGTKGSMGMQLQDQADQNSTDGKIFAGYSGRLLYLTGYRNGSTAVRVQLLKCAINITSRLVIRQSLN